MVADPASSEVLHVLFIDTDGRLKPAIDALRELDQPFEADRVDSLEDGITVATDGAFDCAVVLGAVETESMPAVDGIDAQQTFTQAVPDVPVGVYSLNWPHDVLRKALERDIDIVSAAPEYPELMYRQLRYVAGREPDFESADPLLDSLFEYYPHHLYLKDDVGRFEAISAATASEYDMTREEMIGLSDFDLLEYDVANAAYQEEQGLIESREPMVERIDQWTDAEGRDHWMSITKAPRYDDDGNPVGIVGSSRDVTGEKRKEQMVRELHGASRELVRAEEKAAIGKAAMSLTDEIAVFEDIQVALAEWSSERLEPIEFGSTDGKTLFDQYKAEFEQVYETGDPQYVGTDGTIVEGFDAAGDLKAVILSLGEHGVLGFAGDDETFTDFGIDLANILAANLEAALDRAERERELARQNERLEEFASIVSHDLRNPLNVASAATELLGEETDSENVERVRNALDRMERLIEALLTLARKGQVVGESEFVNIETAARDAWKVIDSPEATLRIDSSGLIAADPHRLIELFENLFRNAIEHGGEDVTVEVGVRDSRDGFYVSDDGTGIEPDDHEKLFEMGFSSEPSGTGYGLYIVSTIVDAHGWDVTAGDSDDGGARFEITGSIVEPTSSTHD